LGPFEDGVGDIGLLPSPFGEVGFAGGEASIVEVFDHELLLSGLLYLPTRFHFHQLILLPLEPYNVVLDFNQALVLQFPLGRLSVFALCFDFSGLGVIER